MAAISTKRPADFTGRQAEILQSQNEALLRERDGEISLFNAQQEEENKTVVDYGQGDQEVIDPENPDAPAVTVKSKNVMIRVNSDLEQVTIGHGNYYDFTPGRVYKVPQHVADHLERLGYVYH